MPAPGTPSPSGREGFAAGLRGAAAVDIGQEALAVLLDLRPFLLGPADLLLLQAARGLADLLADDVAICVRRIRCLGGGAGFRMLFDDGSLDLL